ncbi:alkaline phosphatase family protein [Anaeromyxobacter paludicola]|uniref:Metalloenzyme n=1 Tax=Anaeromyxobacter paludicola TaxID=2918171 RepID=A0ABN6N1Q1_9BACT|nr:alkaline phosphatase family protein [Anaeromyxobacter paludicola]BDG07142.1 metalloenzyme [Anaeromyxobacter paludicola]
MGVLFVFVDGVGAGAPDPAVNPLARAPFLLSRFADGSGAPLPRGGRARLADARLGVPGRPQSATGQATLLTGENAAAAMGRHLLGFPTPALRAFIEARSLFATLASRGKRAAFANAYPVAYLRALGFPCDGEPEWELPARRKLRASATTVAFSAAPGARLATWEDARQGRALTPDLTGVRANRLGAGLPPRSPEQAAGIATALLRAHDLVLLEFFETDEAGHARSSEQALDCLGRLDRFLRAVVAALGPDDSLLVTSDHGNLEDLSSRGHTLAEVPVLGFGPAAGRIDAVSDLTRVAPLLLELA